MDMRFSAEDLAFADEVRAFLDDKLNARLREGAANTPSVFTERGFQKALWRLRNAGD